jgi:hypothetical protein
VLRSFTIADHGLLHKLQKQSVILNNRILLTRGSGSLSRGALLAPLSVFTGTHTCVSRFSSNQQLVFQYHHVAGSPLAHCVFMTPASALESQAFAAVQDAVIKQLGEAGTHSLIAEVEEVHQAFQVLRNCGFSIYARQRVWKLTSAPEPDDSAKPRWRHALERDDFAIHLLRKSLVPGLVQQIEHESTTAEGYVLRHEGEILAYAEVQRGARGIWVEPFVHLDTQPFDEALRELVARLRPRKTRPVYICLRSYQDWLQDALEDMGAQAGPRQVVMARRTSLTLPVEEGRRLLVGNRNAEPSTPIHAHNIRVRYENRMDEL